ncbi:MAG: 7-cyano-7-deazaguanine synthase [archaeon]
MCGISCFLKTNNNYIDPKIINQFLEYGKRRGTDGFGLYVKYDYYRFPKDKEYCNKISNVENQQTIVNEAFSTKSKIQSNYLLITNHRAAPETESEIKSEKDIQPIWDKTCKACLSHNGSVSNYIYQDLYKKYGDTRVSNLDSEAILWMYYQKAGKIKQAMESISGGFAFILYDEIKFKLILCSSHNPLYLGYVDGYGFFASSVEDAIWYMISELKGEEINRNNTLIWEDYYCQELPEFTIAEIDLITFKREDIKYEPNYYHPTWNKKIENNRPITLVAASGGLDSSTTLAMLQQAELNPVAVHFKYGHRGQNAEEKAIENITDYLQVPLYKFDIEENMKQLDHGMLTNEDIEITTGTTEGLKTTVAWTVFRNHFFMTYMGALAESLIIDKNYKQVFLSGGFLQLTESGIYPDNSEKFASAGEKFFKFSIAGTRIKLLYGLCNLLKTDQYFLLNMLGCYDVSKNFISCDRPKLINGIPHNCSKNNKPACGSGLLSHWACKMVGLEDLRNYYEITDSYTAYEPNSTFNIKTFDINKIIDRIIIPEKNKEILRKEIAQGEKK